jgi:uncharacterized membrane protein
MPFLPARASTPPAGERWISVLLGLAGLAYPFLALAGLRLLPPEALLVLPALLLGVRLALGRRGPAEWVLGGAALAMAGLVAVSPELAVRAWPVLVSLGFAALFAGSFLVPPVMAERFARLAEPELPVSARAYLRRVTAAWIVFFLANAAIAAWTVLWGSLEQWALYNGFISYLLVGAMFAGEYLVRRRVRGSAP